MAKEGTLIGQSARKGRLITMALESIHSAKNVSFNEMANKNATREVKAVQPKENVAKPAKQQPDTTMNLNVEAKNLNQELPQEEGVTGKMKDAIDKVNAKIVPSKTRCEFSYHEDTKRVSIKVIDQNTEEVIREIPPEETLDMLSKMWELAGILIDERR